MLHFLRSQIREIENSRVLRWFGLFLALTHVATAVFWLDTIPVFSRAVSGALGAEDAPLCWPQIPDCQWLRVFSAEDMPFVLFAYGALALCAGGLFLRRSMVPLGFVLSVILLAVKFYLFSLDYRTMGNYHYMPFIVCVLYLFVPRKRLLIPIILVGFYVAAGTLKFDVEWLSGAALLAPPMVKGRVLHFLLGYTIFLEIVLAWGLLSARPLVFWVVFSQFVGFHAFSYHIVGPFYPIIMSCLLSIFVFERVFTRADRLRDRRTSKVGGSTGDRSDDDSPEGSIRLLFSGRMGGSTYAVITVFIVLQAYPALVPGDAAVTGEGRLLSLNMLDAKTRCEPLFLARYKGKTVEMSRRRLDLGTRIWCDPIVYWNMARAICAAERLHPDFVDLDVHMVSRKTTDNIYRRVIDAPNFCSKNPDYSVWGANDWIVAEDLAEVEKRFGLGYQRVPRAVPERSESQSPMPATTFVFRGDARRTGVVPRAERFGALGVPTREAWRVDNGNVGIHGASKSSPAVDASGVYVAGDSGGLFAYDHDGGLRWTFKISEADRGIHGTPALDEKSIYFGGYNGRLYKLDKWTGEVEWVIRLGDALGASPLIWQDSLFVGVETASPVNGSVMRIRRDSGRVMWITRALGEQTHSSPVVNEEESMVYLGANNGEFIAFDLETGDERWVFKVDLPVKSTAALIGGRIHFTSWDRHMYALDGRTGQLIWKTDLGARSQSSPTWNPTSDQFIVGNANGEVLGIAARTGAIVWRRGPEGPPFHLMGSGVSVASATGEYWTWIGCSLEELCAFNSRGRLVSRTRLVGTLDGVPTVHGGALYLSERHPGHLVKIRDSL